MRVLVFVPYYPPAFRGGGPIRTVSAMVAAHGDRHDFRVLTRDGDWGTTQRLGVPADQWVPSGRAMVWYRSPGLRGLLTALRQARRLAPEVLYLNSVFAPAETLLPLLLHRLRLLPAGQVVLAPRGELGAGALALKSAKKRALFGVSRLCGLHSDLVWHASTVREADEIRRAAPVRGTPRVVVAQNESPLPNRALRERPAPGERLRVVFLSRISPKKGLDILLAALSSSAAIPPLDVSVYGSTDDPDYLQQCHRLADRAREQGHQVRFAGTVDPSAVLAVFAAHDLFAFPTANENFGHAIVEALCAGCPVALPDTTPWTPTLDRGAGILVASREPDDWARMLAQLAAEGPPQRAARSRAAAEVYNRWQDSRERDSVFDRL
ncbi:glycosyltransferase [Gephyromycinifex aptenodytis]|uniref:glycosyltransferase n=1 Tax=Gephyromycinifex aptenodytis TaxID=2716227 RepID=UPI0014488103|nr:glycosyltransferase [Gephyromycinifex aptenodytis]